MNWAEKSEVPPSGYSYGPPYRPSWQNIVRGIIYIGLGQPRSLAHDALFAIANMPEPPLVRGLDHIPEHGPFVVAANHYERPGLWMAWPALLSSYLVQERTAQDLHWIAIEEWESFSFWGIPIPPEATRLLFERVYTIYGIIAMPSETAAAAERAAAMREAARAMRGGAIIGVMPEGTVGATPELLPAREGVGTFLSFLAAAGAQAVPLGLFEEDGHLVARFGPPLEVRPTGELSREEGDRWVRNRVMIAIRDLLPEALWGAYRDVTAT